MIRIKDHRQQEFFDPWDHSSPKRSQMLDEGRPGLFREDLLKALPVRLSGGKRMPMSATVLNSNDWTGDWHKSRQTGLLKPTGGALDFKRP